MKIVPTLVWAFLFLLGACAVLLHFSDQEKQPFPSIESQRPSGLRSFAEILRKGGYEVVLDRRSEPVFEPNDLAVICDNYRFDRIAEDAPPPRRLLRLEYTRPSSDLENFKVLNPYNPSHPYQAALPSDFSSGSQEGISVLEFATAPRDVIARLARGNSVTLSVTGQLFENAKIGRAENAQVAVDLVRILAPKGSRIVFAEASFGNVEDPSLTESLGHPALIAWRQAMLAGLILVWAVAARFGMPRPVRMKLGSGRDLLDAYANLMRRRRRADVALQMIQETVEADLRSHYSPGRLDDLLRLDVPIPQELRSAMINARLAQTSQDRKRLKSAGEGLMHAYQDWKASL